MSVMQSEPKRRGRPPGRTKVETLEIRSRIVELAKQGHSQRAIAGEVGFAPSAIHQHLAAYMAELTPSSELAEQWRQTRLARADERFRRLAPLALADPPDYAALSALQKEEESITKMLGANLEQAGIVGVFTAESLAKYLEWDAEPVIEGTATEITEGSTE
jgi:hypothetical protein